MFRVLAAGNHLVADFGDQEEAFAFCRSPNHQLLTFDADDLRVVEKYAFVDREHGGRHYEGNYQGARRHKKVGEGPSASFM